MGRCEGWKEPMSLGRVFKLRWWEIRANESYDFGSDMSKALLKEMSPPAIC